MLCKTIFHRAVSNENAHTELLNNFLRYDSLKKGLLELLEMEVQDIDQIHTTTQTNLGIHGRPDLEIFKRGEFRIFIEVKIQNTSLTPNQPSQYYRYLRDCVSAKVRRLVLLAPKSYLHLNDYEGRLKEVKAEQYKLKEDDTKIITWEAILAVIEKVPELSDDLLLQEYAQFLKDEFNLNKFYLNQSEMEILYKQNSGESFRTAVAIVFNVHRRLYDDGIPWNNSASPGTFDNFQDYGFSFELKNGGTLFFGIWFEYWAERNEPFCLALKPNENQDLTKFIATAKKADFHQRPSLRNWLVFAPDSSVLMNNEAEKKLENMLKTIYDDLKK
ncbi:MAG: hypothetical protein NXI09_14095 [Bacteroidetes bacterium]|nr:hypothetical protein [Bacteroidota bacterium]